MVRVPRAQCRITSRVAAEPPTNPPDAARLSESFTGANIVSNGTDQGQSVIRVLW